MIAAGIMPPGGTAPGRAQVVFDEADLALSHSGSVAGSEVSSTRETTREIVTDGHGEGAHDGREGGDGEPWGGIIFGQLLDRSPIKVLARSSFAS